MSGAREPNDLLTRKVPRRVAKVTEALFHEVVEMLGKQKAVRQSSSRLDFLRASTPSSGGVPIVRMIHARRSYATMPPTSEVGASLISPTTPTARGAASYAARVSRASGPANDVTPTVNTVSHKPVCLPVRNSRAL